MTRAVLVLLLAACTTGEVVIPDDELDVVELHQFHVRRRRPVDVLLVIDSSPAMSAMGRRSPRCWKR